mgnify:CR=1 FL=1
MARRLLEHGPTMRAFVRRRVKSNSGFTLVELAVVVVIVGVLSVIAVVGYRKMILSSKLTEAQNMISAIRIAQEEYKTERGTYLDIRGAWCPSDGMTQQKFAWNPTCGAPNTWAALPVHADGPVQFGFRTAAGPTGFSDPFGIGWVNWAAAPTNVPWYLIQAQADLDPGGVPTELVGSSFQNTIFSRNEGE